MIPKEHVSLAPFTTFHIGGPARFFIEARSEKDVEDAILFARQENLPLHILGAGSNVLIPDSGCEGVVLRVALDDIRFENESTEILCIAGAGVSWDTIVDVIGSRGIFGVENLAGIPGLLGGAVVQNIGAYGTELASVFAYADTVQSTSGEHRRIKGSEAQFVYRSSLFKTRSDLIITHVALRFTLGAVRNISYADLARKDAIGVSLNTPPEIATAIRTIRSEKFPQNTEAGSAGSFFKNPVLSHEVADSLKQRFPDMPLFPQEHERVKIPLAWVLDHVLALKGYKKGRVRLYEKQPLVIAAEVGATAAEVEALAHEVAEKVFAEIGIAIEREVETFGKKIFS